MRYTTYLAVTILLALPGSLSEQDWRPREGEELIGTEAPELQGLEWLNSNPLDLEDLRGKVVLVRFWLVGCGFCRNTAPALNDLYARYKDQGFVVLGIHHPKSAAGRRREVVERGAQRLGFEFPVAMDNEWKTINAYWTSKDRSFTSSSFLIDQQGIIRWVHHGGEFYPRGRDPSGVLAYRSLRDKIEALLNGEG